MSRNIVICCDGTGNEITTDLSNVLKLYRMLEESGQQCRYYDPGIGTMGDDTGWSTYRQSARRIFGLVTGRGLNENILDAYRFLIDSYEEGDRIFLFGFSRGAYTVTALAGLLYQIGLLHPEQTNLAKYALKAYRDVPYQKNQDNAWRFSRITNARRVAVHFMGLWDPVSSIIAPRPGTLPTITLQNLPYTSRNPAVRHVRIAASIDEQRRMFRLHPWESNQECKPNPFIEEQETQDFKRVWFCGVHSDVGGGYAEEESALAKIPLQWMADEAQHIGLRLDESFYQRLVMGHEREGSSRQYVEPDPLGQIHDSMQGAWPLLEYIPKRQKWLRWPYRKVVAGFYLPRREPRFIDSSEVLHESVGQRQQQLSDYRPDNLVDDKRQST